MERRGFLFSALAFLGVGKLFGEEKPKFPVVKFKDRLITNTDELFEGIELKLKEGETEAERRTTVWVNKHDAVEYGSLLVWGEVDCSQFYCHNKQGRDWFYYGITSLKPTVNSMTFMPNRNLLCHGEQESKEIINKLKKGK